MQRDVWPVAEHRRCRDAWDGVIRIFHKRATFGIHDRVMADFDRCRRGLLGCGGYHGNCEDDMIEGLQELDETPTESDSNSFNAIMNMPTRKHRNSPNFRPAVCTPEDYITFCPQMDCYVGSSFCPQDDLPINDMDGAAPVEGRFKVLD